MLVENVCDGQFKWPEWHDISRLAYPKSYLKPTVNTLWTPYAELETKKQTMHTSLGPPAQCSRLELQLTLIKTSV